MGKGERDARFPPYLEEEEEEEGGVGAGKKRAPPPCSHGVCVEVGVESILSACFGARQKKPSWRVHSKETRQ